MLMCHCGRCKGAYESDTSPAYIRDHPPRSFIAKLSLGIVVIGVMSTFVLFLIHMESQSYTKTMWFHEEIVQINQTEECFEWNTSKNATITFINTEVSSGLFSANTYHDTVIYSVKTTDEGEHCIDLPHGRNRIEVMVDGNLETKRIFS